MQISVKQAAALLGETEDAVFRRIRAGEMPAITVGEELRVDRAELLEWATSRGIRVEPGLIPARKGGEGGLASLLEALELGGIARGLGGGDAPAVLREVVRHLPLPADVDRDYLYEVMLARESLGSTGIGDGIAIPHVRDPLVLHVPRATVTLCFLDEAVDFDAVDGKPVDTLFAIVSPTIRDHLHLLSRLGYALRDEDFRQALRARAPRERLLEALAAAEAGLGRGGSGDAPARP